MLFEGEGAQMTATSGRIVQTPTGNKPYKVILGHTGTADSEQGVETMREGEALIRLEMPTPPTRDRLRDQPAADA